MFVYIHHKVKHTFHFVKLTETTYRDRIYNVNIQIHQLIALN